MRNTKHGILTDYQYRLLLAAEDGETNRTIAMRFGIKKKTFENRIRRIRRKLDAASVPKQDLLRLV